MESQFINDEKVWKKFDEFLKKMERASDVSGLDKIHNKIDSWNAELETKYEAEQELVEAVGYILRDEIKRTEERMYSTRGKQQEPDWRNDLKQHSERLEKERIIVESIEPGDSTIWSKILESYRFSLELVVADIEQVEKQLAGEKQIVSAEYLEMLQTQKQLVEKYKKCLNDNETD